MTEQPADYEIISTGRARAMDYHRLAAAHYRALAEADELAVQALALCPEFVCEDHRSRAIEAARQAIAAHRALAVDHDSQLQIVIKTIDSADDA